MKRLFKIEWLKSWPSRYFRIMLGIWFLAFIGLPIGFKLFLMYIESNGFSLDQIPGLTATDLPIFDFVDLWQNLTYAYKGISIFLGILIIINITNELDYKTFRQNVIDGMSKTEFLLSKFMLVFGLATAATILVFIMGLIVGYSASPVTDWSSISKHINFLGAYLLHILVFLTLCVLLSILIKRAGMAIAILLFWMFVLEPILSAFLYYNFHFEVLANMLPMEAHWSLIPRPIEKYALRETIFWVSFKSVAIAIAELGVYISACWLLIVKRDIR
jgi:ABC-2 type transport system permease protein